MIMKQFLLIILSFVLSVHYSIGQSASTIKAMTWNIRLDTPYDSADQWSNRKSGLVKEVLKNRPDVLGVQEALNNQMTDLKKRLKGYKSLGVARDDGHKKGEYSAIFYDTRTLLVLRHGTFWLSENPDIAGSRGWDAACNRVVTWGEFKIKKSGQHFLVFNTHFDHVGEQARVESAKLIIRKIHELGNGLPTILTGDFNVSSKHRAYRILTYPENEVVLADSRERATTVIGPDFTWVTFDRTFIPGEIIDFIFTTSDIEIISNEIIDFRHDGRFLSDHLPVLARIKLK